MNHVGLVLVTALFVLLALGVPIAFVLGLLTVAGVWMIGVSPILVAQRIMAGTSVTSLLAVPGFILAGDLMTAGGLSRRLIRIASAIIGHVPGGLSMAGVIAGTFFGAISGSAPATTAAIGSVMIDEMEDRGYERVYGAALATGVGPLGQMIPPSIPMVIWGVLADQSIAKLFLGGAIPGLLAAAGFVVLSYIYAKRNNIPKERRSSFKEFMFACVNGIWALMAPLVILGGIYGGAFTPTEASMVAVLYSVIVGVFVYRDLKLSQIPAIILAAMKTTSMIVFIIATAFGFSWVLASEEIPQKATEAIFALTNSPAAIIIIMCVILLILGAVMDNVSAMVILSTVLISVGDKIGMSPIQLGVFVVITFAVGMVTPPVGYSLFVGSSISGLSIERISQYLWPFIIVLVVVVLMIGFIPAVSLALPSLLR
ncbi:MAG TPA: TRAP transporter large permease [Gammaproteobacteria bacterium]|nr:TRAP transporter large permease [Gammaproteobacteria bacterium]